MKKVLAILLTLAVLLGTYLFYQRQQVASGLKELLKGKTYSSYGIKIEIPPSEGSVQGWLKPYINIPKVVLDLSAWGVKQTVPLENAVASRKLWRQSGILLQVPRELPFGKNVKIIKPYAELTSDNTIVILGTEALEFADESTKAKEGKPIDSLKIFAPKLFMEKWTGTLPDFELAWNKLVYQEGKDAKLELAPLSLTLKSKEEKGRRYFELLLRQQGGAFQDEEDQADLGALEYKSKGDLNDLKEADFKALFSEIQKFKTELSQNFSPDSKDMQAVPANFQNSFQGLLLQASQLLSSSLERLDLKNKDADLSWQGMKITRAGETKALVEPLMLHYDVQYSARGFAYAIKGELKKIEILSGKTPILLEGLHYQQSAQYDGISSAELLRFYFNYMFQSLSMSFPNVVYSFPEGFFPFVLTYIAQYPDEADFVFSIDKIEYKNAEFERLHRNSALSFHLKPQRVDYEIKGDFDWRYLDTTNKNPLQSPIEAGHVRFAMGLDLPWKELIALARKVAADPVAHTSLSSEAVAAVFAGKKSQYDFQLFVDLGKNYFTFDWDSKIASPLMDALGEIKISEATGNFSAEQFIEKTRQAWIEQGTLHIEANVERFSKFKKFLNEVEPGTAANLLLLTAPYVQLDSQADTLKSKIEFKDKQILVNGTPNATLNQILAPYLAK